MATTSRARAKPNTYTKLPTRVVSSDDLVLELDGDEYHPHKGESVTFRGKSSVNDWLMRMKLEAAGVENLAEMADLVDEVYTSLARRIVSWDWTDDAGEAYESPPTVAVLKSLMPEEVNWLFAHCDPVRRTEDDLKNADSPST